jgi:hypothetical protein
MKSPLLKKAIPHIVAVALFLVLSLIFCSPVLEGNILSQDDITKWKGVAQDAFQYKEKNGHFPLWNSNIFGGMPNYQVAMEGKSALPDLVSIFSLGLPKPVNFFFLACISFYILGLALRVRPIVAMIGAAAFAFSTYNAVIIHAGHDTQMLATAFMPLLLAGLIFTFNKKYWLGLAITTLAAYQQIGVNHIQISYYFFLVAVAVTIAYVITWIRKKEWKHMMIAAAITIAGAVIGLAGSALALMTTAEYTKYTMRGGKSISIEGDTVKSANTSGLDTAYAFEYSLGKAETFTLLMPNSFGGGSGEPLKEDTKVIPRLMEKGIPENNAREVAQSFSRYWGELPFTAGPAYLGVLIAILGVIGFVIVKSPLRWALLTVTILGIILSWGKNLPAFNTFLFENLPLYNKFRAPSMAQVIPQFTVTIIATLALQALLFDSKAQQILKTNFRQILYAVGGLCALVLLLYLAMDYTSVQDAIAANNLKRAGADDEITRAFIGGLKEDRKAMFGGQLLRSIGFAALLLGMFYFYKRNWIKNWVVAAGIIVISTVELMVISKNYLPNRSYVNPDLLASENFLPKLYEQRIMQDKDPNFRVYNMTVNPLFDARTSYFFKSVTGYHPARLRLYQDIIDRYLYRGSPVVDMLNTKYFLEPDSAGRVGVTMNPNASGPCWFVKYVRIVEGPVEEFKSLDNLHFRDTAIVNSSFNKQVVQPVPDSSASIRMVKFDNDQMEYESNAASPQFAVFSEIYYPKGWNAYIDGKATEYCKTNYLLRGLSVPAGKHNITFKFEPQSYARGVKISFIASILILVIFLGGMFMQWWTDRKKVRVTA